MSDKCVACGEVAEGKPLYKKLGSSDCSTDVFTALHEMQLISLPFIEKDNHYICWDCDETISEEYSTFIRTESKRKANEVKRKRQDEARNIKLKKKLKRAFKKVHEENLRASGITPPVSKYKMKEKEREENKYHSSHCILCKCSFEENQGRGFQRFTLQKMVNDEHDVAQVLQKLNVQLDIDLSEEVKRKRFVCCQCYNKMRRNFKSKNKNELIDVNKTSLNSPQIDSINEQTQDDFKRRPTAEEHAAEIAKLIPPSLANLYKVVTKDEPTKNKGSKKHSHRSRHDKKSHKKSKKRKENPPSSSSSASNTSEDSSKNSSSSSSSDSSDSSDSDSVSPIKGEKMFKNNISIRKDSNRSDKNTNKNNSDISNENNFDKLSTKMKNNVSETTFQNTGISKGFAGISASRNLSSTIPQNMFNDGLHVDKEVLKDGQCNICGLKLASQPTSFWYSLNSLMPSVSGVTVADALQILDSKLCSVSPGVRKKKLVCKPCYSRVCNGFRSQIIQRIAEKKGISVDKIEASKLKVSMMEKTGDSSNDKVNGSCNNKLKDANPSSDLLGPVKHNSDSHKKKKKKKDKHHSKKELKSKYSNNIVKDISTVNALPKNPFFKLRRATLLSSPKYNHDMELLKLINKSRHLQYKGKVVKLYNVCVHVAELKEILPPSAFKMEPVRLELLNDVHIYSNFYRNLKNKIDWQMCILCQKAKLSLEDTSYWLDDPVAPPNLMVPLRWAHLTLVSPNSQSRAEIAIENGKVCLSCHQTLKEKFGSFVGSKVAVSHGLSSEKIVLDKYKVSFDSKAMNIIADPLEKGVTVQEVRKKHMIGPKSKRTLIDKANSKNNKLQTTSDGTDSKYDSGLKSVVLEESKLSEINYKIDMPTCPPKDNVSLDLALSETSGSEDEGSVCNTEKKILETKMEIIKKSVINAPSIINEDKKISINSEINFSKGETNNCEINDRRELDTVLKEASCEDQLVERNGQTSNVDLVKPDINEKGSFGELISQPDKLVISETKVNCLDEDQSLNVQTNNKSPETQNKDDLSQVVPKLATVISLEKSENTSLVNNNLELKKQHDISSNLDNNSCCLAENLDNSDNTSINKNCKSVVANISDNMQPGFDGCPTKCNNAIESHSKLISEHENSISEVTKGSAAVVNIPSPESSNVSESGCDINNLIEDEIVNDESFDDRKEVTISKDNIETEKNVCDPANGRDNSLVVEQAQGEQKSDYESSIPVMGTVTESETLISNDDSGNYEDDKSETPRAVEKDITDIGSRKLEGNASSEFKNEVCDKYKLNLVQISETNTLGEIEINNGNKNVVSEIAAERLMDNNDVAAVDTNTQLELKIDEGNAVKKAHKTKTTNNLDQLKRDFNIDDKNGNPDIKKKIIDKSTPVKEITIPSTPYELESGVNSKTITAKVSESETLNEIEVKNDNINILDDKTNETISQVENANKIEIVGRNIEHTEQKEATSVETIREHDVEESLGKCPIEGNASTRIAPSEPVTSSLCLEEMDIGTSGYVKEPSTSFSLNSGKTADNHVPPKVGESETKFLDNTNDIDETGTSSKIFNVESETRIINQVIDDNGISEHLGEDLSGPTCGIKDVEEQAIEDTSNGKAKSSVVEENFNNEHVSGENPQMICSTSNESIGACENSKIPVCEELNEIETELNIQAPVVENSEKVIVSNQNKNTSVNKALKTRSSTRKKKRSSHIANDKCLSDLIDKENANSVNVITDYLNAQREKIRELIKPIASEEIHNNAMTCVETVSENLIKINSKLDKAHARVSSPSNNISAREILDKSLSKKKEFSAIEKMDKPASSSSSRSSPFDDDRTTFDMQDLSSLSLGIDHQLEEMGEDTVAPFAQRKKCRRPQTLISDGESGNVASDKEIIPEETTATCVGNIWQSIQGISIDDLLTKEDPQPLKLSQYNVGVAMALNDLRVLIGASLEDLLSWLKKLLPLELAEKELEPCIEKFSSYLFSLGRSNEVLEPKKLKEPLSEDLFTSSCKQTNEVEEIKINECFIEDVMDESFAPTESKIQWDDYLAPVNMDNLLKGKESRVTWTQFNNGLLYALWKVNNLLNGDEDNFVRWLSLTSTTPMRASDYSAMSKAVTALDNHLQMFPDEISKLVAPIVIKSQSSKKDVPGSNKNIPKDSEAPKVSKSNDDCDVVVLDETSVKDTSPQDDIIFLHTANNNNNNNTPGKRTGDNFPYPPSKKTARVRPQPSNEARVERTSARRRQSMSEKIGERRSLLKVLDTDAINQRRQSMSEKIGDQRSLLKVLDTDAINQRSFRAIQTNNDIHPPIEPVTVANCFNRPKRNLNELGFGYVDTTKARDDSQKNIVTDNGKKRKKVWNNVQRLDDLGPVFVNSQTSDNYETIVNKNARSNERLDAEPLIVNNASVEGLPIITKVSGGNSGDNSSINNLQPGNSGTKDPKVNINIRNQNINIQSLSPQVVNESLSAQLQQALINQAQFNLNNSQFFSTISQNCPNSNNLNPQNFNQTGVPMIPVMSPSGFVTMVPLTVRRLPNLASTSVGGSSPFAVSAESNSTFNLQSITNQKDNPKEMELESKVSVLEQQLLEIQKQNNQLFELNKKLLEKSTTANDPKNKTNNTLNKKNSPPKINDLPLPSPIAEQSQVGIKFLRGHTPKIVPKKLKPSFEEALQYNYKPKK